MPVQPYEELVRIARSQITEIDPSECDVKRRRNSRSYAHQLIDIREPSELKDLAIPGAINLPRGLLEASIADHLPDPSLPVYLICQAGGRSALAAQALEKMGYEAVQSVRGGVNAWLAAGLSVRDGNTTCGELSDQSISWEEVRALFPIAYRSVPIMGGSSASLLYLDHAASTHAPTCVIERYSRFMADEYANIHRGNHHLSRKSTGLFDDCYHIVSDFIGGDLDHSAVVFLTNTTQAIDLVSHVMADREGKVIVSEMEHHSNTLPHRKRGEVLVAKIKRDGSLDMEHLEALLRDNPVKLVSITGGSNVTGWLPDVHAIARLAHQHGALLALDCAQRLAHYPIDVKSPDDPEHIDFVAGAGHKAYAPFGASFLYGPREVLDAAPPYLPGGGTASKVGPNSVTFVPSPDRHQGGTPNIGGVIAMAEALRLLKRIGMQRVREHEMEINRKAMEALQAIDGVTVYGPADVEQRLGVFSFNIEGVSDLLASAVLSEERGIACRNGRFCAHIYMDRLLEYQGGAVSEPGVDAGAVRASFGLYNTVDDVDRLVEAVSMIARKEWRGHYRMKENSISADFAGRCNDRWMEVEDD